MLVRIAFTPVGKFLPFLYETSGNPKQYNLDQNQPACSSLAKESPPFK